MNTLTFRTQYDAAVGVDREGDAIRGVTIMQLGDIKSIDARKFYVDQTSLEQFVRLASMAGEGLRARLTHDGEGIGTYLGRWTNPRIDGDRVRMDLQLSPRSHDSPQGDIGKYVLNMSESDPDMLGASMVSAMDRLAMQKERRSDGFMPIRIRSVVGADIVDTPALASGMFAAGQNTGDDDMSEAAQAGITQEQFDAGLKAGLESFGKTLTEAILSQVAEKFAVKEAAGESEQLDAEEARKAGAKAATEIMAFAAAAGLKDHEKLATEAIEKGISVEAFKASLADRLIAQNPMSKSDADPEADPHKKFRDEFRAQQKDLARFGVVDEDAYIRTRCRDEGLEVPAKKAG